MSREKVLGAVRAALGAGRDEAARQTAVAARLAVPPGHIVPARARQPALALGDLFARQLAAQGAEVIPVADAGAVPAAIAGYLRAHAMPLRVRAGDDPYLAGIDWANEPGLERQSGPAHGDDTAGLSRAVAGVAETGTLVLASGADNPVTLAFLPDTHIVIVTAETIVGSYEEALDRVQAELGDSHLPRTLNLVSGPSRTADIGGKIVRGAHGPRRLAVIVVGRMPGEGEAASPSSRGSSADSV